MIRGRRLPVEPGEAGEAGDLHYRHRPIFAALAIVLTALCVVVEFQLFRAYTDTARATREFVRTTDAQSAVANVQREGLTIIAAVERLREGDRLGAIDLQRALLERQMSVLAAATERFDGRRAERRAMRALLVSFDGQLSEMRVRGRASGVATRVPQMRRTLTRLDVMIKELSDAEEHDLYRALSHTLAQRGNRQRLLLGLGAIGLVIALASALFLRRSVGREFARAFSALAREVQERAALQDQLSHSALHDSLTGLANRVKFRETLRETLQGHPEPNSLAVLYLDLDGFKMVNDTYGHDAGDELLCGVAKRLVGVVRSDDHAARLGGDEFAVLLSAIDGERGASRIAQRLLEAIGEPFAICDRSVTVGASIGIAMIDTHLTDPEEALRKADLAMYSAKNEGKGAYRYFSDEMTVAADARGRLEEELRRAHAEDEFELFFQPIVEIESERPIGFEALIRWRHPERGLLMPGEFLSVAEDSGLIVAMGRHVVEEACRQAAGWLPGSDGVPLWVSVNLSPRQLKAPGLVEYVGAALEASGLAPERLMLEISEMTLLKDARNMAPKVAELRALGIRIALDDFGAGQSSLGYLRFLQIDVLKIDKCFIDQITEDTAGARLAQAVVRLGGQIRIETIAEGVERPDQLLALAATGCHMAQGFHFSRPVPAAAVAALISPQRAPLRALAIPS